MTHRRDFVASCGALVLALSGCQSMLSRTRLAKLELDVPHPDDYEPVLRALIETILPFDHPRFPRISAAEVQGRLLALFPFEEERRYLVLQKALMVFDRVDLFPLLQTPMVAEERTLLHATDATIAERVTQDQRLYDEFRRTLASGAGSFTALQPQARVAYLRLWGQSGFNGKQLFYHSAKRLVMVTAYSLSDFWRVIGYAGPLLKQS